MREVLDVFVAGRARPAGSKTSGVSYRKNEQGEREPIRRADGRIVTFTKDSSGPEGAAWREDVREVVMRVYGGPRLQACRLALVFVRARPQGHYGSGRNAGRLRAGAPKLPTPRPDALKLARAVEDALTGILYADDAAVCELAVAKTYGREPGVRIQAWRLEP